jgi:hypothetical protein
MQPDGISPLPRVESGVGLAVVMQTAIIGEADALCTRDQDFFEPPAEAFLQRAGITVLDDVALMQRLRS